MTKYEICLRHLVTKEVLLALSIDSAVLSELQEFANGSDKVAVTLDLKGCSCADNQVRNAILVPPMLRSSQPNFGSESDHQALVDSSEDENDDSDTELSNLAYNLSSDPQDDRPSPCSNLPCGDISSCGALPQSSSPTSTLTQSPAETEISAHLSDTGRNTSDDSSACPTSKDVNIIKKSHVLFGKKNSSKGLGNDDYTATAYYRKRIEELSSMYQNGSKNRKNIIAEELYQEVETKGYVCVLEEKQLLKKRALDRMKQALREKRISPKRKDHDDHDPKRKVEHKGAKRSKT